MSATKISDLLPIPEDAARPHAYQVFGLEGGEQDANKIKAAVQAVLQHLKDVKEETNPKLWKKAAKAVDQARKILSDPKKRAALDARFGVIDFSDSIPESEDPLANILPTTNPLTTAAPTSSDPLAAVMPSGDPMAAAPMTTTPGTAPAAPMSVPSTTQPAAVTQASVATQPTFAPQQGAVAVQAPTPEPAPVAPAPRVSPGVVRTRKASRRHKSTFGMVAFGTFMLTCFAVIGGLGYFLFFGPGQLNIVQSGDDISISTEKPKPPAKQQPRRVRSRPANTDPILGNVPASGISDSVGTIAAPVDVDVPKPNMPKVAEEFPMVADGATTTGTVVADMSMTEPSTPDMANDPDMTNNSEVMTVEAPKVEKGELTDEMIAKADEAIAKVEQLIRAKNWSTMKEEADKLTEMMLSDQQAPYAQALYDLADLATFYRGGISKGIMTLQATQTFEITDGLQVAVVEKNPDGIILRVNGRNKTYTLTDMPFVLADRLCGFRFRRTILPISLPNTAFTRLQKRELTSIDPKQSIGSRL